MQKPDDHGHVWPASADINFSICSMSHAISSTIVLSKTATSYIRWNVTKTLSKSMAAFCHFAPVWSNFSIVFTSNKFGTPLKSLLSRSFWMNFIDKMLEVLLFIFFIFHLPWVVSWHPCRVRVVVVVVVVITAIFFFYLAFRAFRSCSWRFCLNGRFVFCWCPCGRFRRCLFCWILFSVPWCSFLCLIFYKVFDAKKINFSLVALFFSSGVLLYVFLADIALCSSSLVVLQGRFWMLLGIKKWFCSWWSYPLGFWCWLWFLLNGLFNYFFWFLLFFRCFFLYWFWYCFFPWFFIINFFYDDLCQIINIINNFL